MPSNYGEGFPRGILEAICLGIPVIATKNASAENFDDSNVFLIKDNKVKTIKKLTKIKLTNCNNINIVFTVMVNLVVGDFFFSPKPLW